MMATLAAVTHMPALGLLGEDGRLERSTEPFRRWYEDKQELCLQSPEVKRVLDGQANAAVLKLDGLAIDVAAIADRDGGRHVLLTLPTGELPSLGDPGDALLDGALDESPALVWLKDLEGRYVRVNPRFTTFLNTSEERLLGRTDGELPPAETVDGPRAQERDAGAEEPLQLEYFVGPFQGRAALVVLRFPVGDSQGVPSLVCGVAAPSSEAQVARSEAARLLRVERWSRLDADSVRAELLAEWGLLPDARGRAATPVSAPEGGAGSAEREAAVAEARAERATAVAERDSALSANEQLTAELAAAQKRLADLERALKAARADGASGDAEAKLAEQAAELDRALTRERERAEELERSLALVRQRLGDDAEAARAEVQRARADADAARTEVQRARADAESARTDLDKARADADAARTAAVVERESTAKAKAELERALRQSQDQLAALERQQGSDTSGAELRAAEKARVAAENALADAIAERDATLKARAALAGELEQERKQVAALEKSTAAAEERIRELTGGLERERVRAAGLEQAQARASELEREVRTATMRADKAEVELEVAVGQAEKAEAALRSALARADEAAGQQGSEASAADLRAAEKARVAAENALADAIAERDATLKARAALAGELEQERKQVATLRESAAAAEGRVRELTGGLERERVRAAGLEQAQARVAELEREVRTATMRADKAEVELQVAVAQSAKAEAELDRGRARVAALEEKLDQGRAEISELEGERKLDRARIAELEGERKLDRARIAELEGERKLDRARIAELESELERARAKALEDESAIASLEARLDEAEAQPTAAVVDAPAQPADEQPAAVPTVAELAKRGAPVEASATELAGGVSWQPEAKRALSASLARESVWRNVLKETVQVLGTEGGWDTVTAWLPDEANNLDCAATWTAHASLDRFEALTWEVPVKREGSLLDQALQAPHLTWLTDIDAVDDARLQTASAHGMSSALLLPVRSGTTTIGLLELLTHDSIEPDAQIALSLEASALQLGRFGQLLSLGKSA